MAEPTKRSWLRYGCFGCLGLVGIVVLLVALTVLTAFLGVKRQDVAEGPSQAPATLAFGEAHRAGPGKVVLDLRHGEFEIHAAAPGESVGVEARYDRKRYELIEQFEPGVRGRWVYRVSFSGKGSGLLNVAQQFLGGVAPEVRVRLPTDVPVELEVVAGKGGLRLDLDRLWLSDVRVEASWAGVEVACSEPLEHPVGSLELLMDMGGIETAGLGHASPGRLLVDCSNAGGLVDLSGAWSRDGDVGITGRNAGLAVQLPTNVRIERSGRPIPPPASAEFPVPTLRIDSTIANGNIEFID